MDRVRLVPYRLRCSRIDRELAVGFDPNHDPDRRRRACELTARRHRRDLARKLEELIGEAAGSPHWQRPERWSAIRDASPRLTVLAQTLAGRTEVSPQGIARAELLMKDGTGPLYGPDRGNGLPSAIEAALASLELGPMLEPARDWARAGAPIADPGTARIRGHRGSP
jgi:hypothetical protein